MKSNISSLLILIIIGIDLNVAQNISNITTGNYQNDVRDINNWCNSTSLAQLDLTSLANRANISEHCSNVAAGIFGRKFAANLITIGNESPTMIDLQNATNILRHFGHSITQLSLQFNYTVETCTPYAIAMNRKLLNDINEYCRNSLFKFEIRYSDCDVGIFNEIKGPFERAESVLIKLIRFTTNTNEVRLSEIFPNVRHLELDFQRFTDPNFVDTEFRHMNELGIASGMLDNYFEDHLKGLLKKNPQIRYVSVESPRYQIFQHLYKELRNLKELRILHSIREDPKMSTIFFRNIKTLDIRLAPGECSLPKRINFGKSLNELTLHCSYADIGSEYFDFLSEYPRIKKLSAGNNLNNANLVKLIGKFPLLSEAWFSFGFDVFGESIIKFIKQSNRLNVLHFNHSFNENRENFKQLLEFGLADAFRVNYRNISTSSEYTIERKVPVGCASKVNAFNAFAVFMVMYITRIFFS